MHSPSKLQKKDETRIVAPSFSLANTWISEGIKQIANQRITDLGLSLSLAQHVYEMDSCNSSSINSRIADLHNAFLDKHVKFVLAAIGGLNSYELLPYLDFELIKKNPKAFCGYSDITVLQNAILAKTGLITYSGPHYLNFGEKKGFDYTLDYFKKALFSHESYEIIASDSWSDDKWVRNQEQRNFHPHEGYRVLQPGETEGTLRGGNLGSLILLQGTEYLPNIEAGILFIEECIPCDILKFDKQLESLLQSIRWNISGLIIGKFEQDANIDKFKLQDIITNKPQLKNIPVIANVNIGHVYPFATVPIGGKIHLDLGDNGYKIQIIQH